MSIKGYSFVVKGTEVVNGNPTWPAAMRVMLSKRDAIILISELAKAASCDDDDDMVAFSVVGKLTEDAE